MSSPRFVVGFELSIFSLLSSVLHIIVLLFFFAIVLSVLRLTASNYPLPEGVPGVE